MTGRGDCVIGLSSLFFDADKAVGFQRFQKSHDLNGLNDYCFSRAASKKKAGIEIDKEANLRHAATLAHTARADQGTVNDCLKYL